MREILFRAKSIEHGQWVYGTPMPGPPDTMKILKEIQRIVFFDVQESDSVWVDLDTLSQFTGIENAEHRKIFEGDILAWNTGNHTYPITIRWGEKTAGFYGRILTDETKIYFDATLYKECQIIGNIWDTPEKALPTKIETA